MKPLERRRVSLPLVLSLFAAMADRAAVRALCSAIQGNNKQCRALSGILRWTEPRKHLQIYVSIFLHLLSINSICT